MPWFVRFENGDDLVALRHHVETRLAWYKQNTGAYVEQVILFEAVVTALADARYATSVTLMDTDAPAPVAKKTSTPLRVEAKLCPLHPLYGAKRRPRSTCEGCWEQYRRINGEAAYRSARLKAGKSKADT